MRGHIDPPSYEWWLDDRGHPWVKHQCLEWHPTAWRLPPPWKVDGDGIAPSLNCTLCGLHVVVGPDERAPFRLWNWEIGEDLVCGSCDGKPVPDPKCGFCHGTGIDDPAAPPKDQTINPWRDPRIVDDPRIEHTNPVVRRAAEHLHNNESMHLHVDISARVCVYCALRASRVVAIVTELAG